MDLTVTLVCELFNVEASSIMMLDEEKGKFVIKAACGLSDDYVKKQKITEKDIIYLFSSLPHKPICIIDITNTNIGDSELNKKEGLVSAVCSGILVDGKLFGVLFLYSKKRKIFPDEDITMIRSLTMQLGIALKNSELYEKSVKTSKGLIKTLAALESEKDYYTANHSEKVAQLAVLIAEKCGIKDRYALEEIYIAGLLHDIGKIAIDKSLLSKRGGLSPEEIKLLKKHPEVGYEIIKNIPNLEKVAICIKYHHERYDGGGYPEGLMGERIPLCARILNLADSIEAMLSDRPYRDALSLEEIKKELLNEKGRQFDPHLTDIALEILDALYSDTTSMNNSV